LRSAKKENLLSFRWMEITSVAAFDGRNAVEKEGQGFKESTDQGF
jgi:hypothetical protein